MGLFEAPAIVDYPCVHTLNTRDPSTAKPQERRSSRSNGTASMTQAEVLDFFANLGEYDHFLAVHPAEGSQLKQTDCLHVFGQKLDRIASCRKVRHNLGLVVRNRWSPSGRDGESEIMASSIGFEWGSVSITGNFRDNNEDNCFVDSGARFFLVADGMGGQSAGEKASELAVELISEKLRQWVDFEKAQSSEVVAAIDKAVNHANMEIMALGELEPSYKSMGTTVAFLVSAGNHLYIGGVGDSRAYLLRDGTLEQLTEDHSLTQALLKAGTITPEEAVTHRYKNVLYRYLGTKEGGTGTNPRHLEPKSGDRYMLCSDGVTDGTKPDQIKSILEAESNPQRAAERLVEAAQAGGSKDNITCVVVHVK